MAIVAVYQGQGGRIDLEYSIEPNVENNSSTLYVSTYVVKTNASYITYRTAPVTFTLTVNGVAVTHSWTFDFRQMTTGTRYGIKSSVTTINHNSDGTKSNVAASVYCATGTEGLSVISGSVSIAIPTIGRASLPTTNAWGANMGIPLSIYTNRASESFTHTLRYTFGNQSGTIASNVGAGYNWILPLELANAIPNSTSGSGTITCDTYSGATLIGTKSVAFGATIPDDMGPVIHSVTTSEAVPGIAAQFGTYVQGKSKLSVNVDCDGAYGSTVTRCVTTILGADYVGASFTTDVLATTYAVYIRTVVTDTRGRQSATQVSINISDYFSPTISHFEVDRAFSNGEESVDEGTYLKADFKINIAGVYGANTKSWVLEYRPTGGTWSTITSGSDYDVDTFKVSATPILDVDETYEARLTVSDWFSSTTAVVPISTAFVMLDIHAMGTGIGIGMVSSESTTLQIAGSMKLNGTRMDESGIPMAGNDSITYWQSIKQGKYFCIPGQITNQPSAYGFMDVFKSGSDFNILWYVQASGAIYRKSGNSSTQTGWILLH